MIKRSTFFFTILAASVGLALFIVKYQVQELADQLTTIDQGIVSERQAIHVLKAEWSHLNEPERLRVLAKRYLNMVPLDYKQYLTDAMFGENLAEIDARTSIAETEISELSFSDRMKNALEEGAKR